MMKSIKLPNHKENDHRIEHPLKCKFSEINLHLFWCIFYGK